MKKISLNNNWKYAHLGENDWQEITLPHDAMLTEPRDASSQGGTNTGFFRCRDYEYVTEFDAPQDSAAIEFEGIYHRSEVYVDGKQEPSHPNGYFGFTVPVTPGHHKVQVIARNAQQPSSRWYTGAGIYRPVWLICQSEKHILPETISIRTTNWEKREIEISCAANAPGKISVEILDGKNTLTACVMNEKCNLCCANAELWSVDNPKLYTCRLTFGEDKHEIKFGIRQVSCDAKHGFCMNGQRIILKGACFHHDNGLIGAAGHPFAERRKIQLLKNAGYNAIRSSHNPCSKAILDVCDELGMLVLDEYVDCWYTHKTIYDYADYVKGNWKKDLQLIVEKDRNHPCVVMYSIGNEVSETASVEGIALAKNMQDYLHSIDDRPVTCGVNIFFNFLSSMGFGVYSDEKAKKEAEKAAKAPAKKKKAVGSEFVNNIAGFFGAGFMKFGATLHGSDVKTRGIFSALDVAGYNYGVKRYAHDIKKYPDRVILGSETFVSDAAKFYDIAKSNPALIGDFVWTGIDYIGEVGLGAWEYKDYAPDFSHGPGWLTAGAGAVDITGKETCQTSYTKAAFEMIPVAIGVIPVKYASEKHSPGAWRMTNAVESWNWHGCDGMKTKVEIYGRGASAELILNGSTLGRKKIPENARTIFDVTYYPGTLEAVIYDEKGVETARTSLKTATESTHLSVIPEASSVSVDELLYIRMKYTDSDGQVNPLAQGEITASVSGGQLIAIGNACSYNERGYTGNSTMAYFGEALAVVRPEGEKSITFTCTSPYGNAAAEIPAKK